MAYFFLHHHCHYCSPHLSAHMLGWFRVRLHQSVRLFISDKQSRLARILRARIFMLILSSNRTLGHVTVMHSIFILQCQSVSSFFSLLLIRIIVFVSFSWRLSPCLVDRFSSKNLFDTVNNRKICAQRHASIDIGSNGTFVIFLHFAGISILPLRALG